MNKKARNREIIEIAEKRIILTWERLRGHKIFRGKFKSLGLITAMCLKMF